MRVLYVGHDGHAAEQTAGELHRLAELVDVACTPGRARELLALEPEAWDVVLVDLDPPDDQRLALLACLPALGASAVPVAIAAAGDEATRLRALAAGVRQRLVRRHGALERPAHVLAAAAAAARSARVRRSRRVRAMYVSADAAAAHAARRHLARRAPHVTLDVAATVAEALLHLDAAAAARLEILFVDHRLPALGAVRLLEHARRARPELPVVVLARPEDEEEAMSLVRLGAAGCIVKTPGHLLQVEAAIERAQATRLPGTDRPPDDRDEHYRVLFEESPVGVLQVDAMTARVMRVNDALCRITGHARETLIGMCARDLTHPEDWPATRAVVRDMLDGARSRYSLEKRYRRRDGSSVWVRTDVTLVRDAGGHPLYSIGIVRDVTERRRAEAELRQRDHLLQAVMQSLSSHVVVLDRGGVVTYASKAWDDFAGPGAGALGRLSVGERYLQADRNGAGSGGLGAVAQAGIEAVMSGRLSGFVTEYPCPASGRPRWFLMHVNPMPPEHGGVVISHTDITPQKAAEAALAEEKRKYQEIFEGAGVALWEADFSAVQARLAGLAPEERADLRAYLLEHRDLVREAMRLVRVVAVNRHAVRLHGARDKSELIDRVVELALPETEEAFVEQLVALAEGRPSLEMETVALTLQGEPRHILFSTVYPPGRAATRVLLSAVDITERKRAERALQTSEARYRNVVENQIDLICRYLPDTTLTFVNDACCRYFGRRREELIGARFIELIPPDERGRVLAHLAALGDAPRTIELRLVRPDGTVTWQQWIDRAIPGPDGTPIEIQAIGRDVTEQRRAEEALRESEEALRRSRDQVQQLAGQLIEAQERERRRISRELHDDLNQKVAALAIGISRLRRRVHGLAEDPLREELSALQHRAMGLADDVRRLSHDLHPAVLEHAGLGPALRAHCDELRRDTGMRVDIHAGPEVERLRPDVALCLYRVAQEALHNTARHAGVGAARLVLDADDGAVRLTITDNGPGFDLRSALRPRGLGLVSIEERVRLLQGTVAVRSEPGRGTEISVRVPDAWRPA